jgi:4-hydroxymandelate oxidase
LYCYRDRAITRELVQRAEAAGYAALCLTVDVPVHGPRERDIRNRFKLPSNTPVANLAHLMPEAVEGSALVKYISERFDATLTWDSLAWLRGLTRLPLVVKGVLTAEDARLAVQHGVAGIGVSNHGGRQLDTAVATCDALAEVVEAAAGGAEVFVDGGIRRGTDVLKALALGARGVMIGRPYLWGLAVDGEAGVKRVLDLLRDDLRIAMALCGCRRMADVGRALVR